jgi:hypothetical protein
MLPRKQGINMAMNINKWSILAIALSINATRECSISRVIGLRYNTDWIFTGTNEIGYRMGDEKNSNCNSTSQIWLRSRILTNNGAVINEKNNEIP